MALAMSTLVLSGCARRDFPDRTSAPEVVVFQIESSAPEKQTSIPAPVESTPKAEAYAAANITAAPATPLEAETQEALEQQASFADINRLMDELDNALDELDASMTAADKDALTDSALLALAK